MNKGLTFYNTAVNGKAPRIAYQGSRSAINIIEPWERTLVENHWNAVKQPGWFDGNPGCLWDASKEGLTCIRMPFSLYNALSYFEEKGLGNIFSENTRKIVRALAFGCYIESSDGLAVVQRRAGGLLAGGKLDASSTGVANIKEDTINLEGMMLGKIEAELGLKREDLGPLIFTGNHEPGDYHSSMCTFKTIANKEFGKINEGRNEKRVPYLHGVPVKWLPGFLIDHYVGITEPQIIGDGAATLMRALEPEQFKEVVEELRKRGVNIRFGEVRDREFVEGKSP